MKLKSPTLSSFIFLIACGILLSCSSKSSPSNMLSGSNTNNSIISKVDNLINSIDEFLPDHYIPENNFDGVYKDNEGTFKTDCFIFEDKKMYKQGAQGSVCAVNSMFNLCSLYYSSSKYNLPIHPLNLVDLYDFTNFENYVNDRKDHLLKELNIYKGYSIKDLKEGYKGTRLSKLQYSYEYLIDQGIFCVNDSDNKIIGINEDTLLNLMKDEFNAPRNDLHQQVYNFQYLEQNGGIGILEVANKCRKKYGLNFTCWSICTGSYLYNHRHASFKEAANITNKKLLDEAWMLVAMDPSRKHATYLLRKSKDTFLKLDPLSSTEGGGVYSEIVNADEFMENYISNGLIWVSLPRYLPFCKCCCTSDDFQFYKDLTNHPLLPDDVKEIEKEEFNKSLLARIEYEKTQVILPL